MDMGMYMVRLVSGKNVFVQWVKKVMSAGQKCSSSSQTKASKCSNGKVQMEENGRENVQAISHNYTDR
jgi:hypothetical protein